MAFHYIKERIQLFFRIIEEFHFVLNTMKYIETLMLISYIQEKYSHLLKLHVNSNFQSQIIRNFNYNVSLIKISLLYYPILHVIIISVFFRC